MTYLDELLGLRVASVAREKARRPVGSLQAAASSRSDYRDFAGALRGRSPAIIAEFKRSSPSAGPIARSADPALVASAYERGGAAALSVLTEPDRFGGSFADLRAARAATSLPVLCKDFIVDEYQIWAAAAEGADAVLLIVAALDEFRLREFIDIAGGLGLAALVEVHDMEEAVRSVAAGARIVGINNRDLKTFEVDRGVAARVRPVLPASTIVVAESGYATSEQILECAAARIDAVLVGEHLMRAADPESALATLLGRRAC
jgi:indole-3-glycerol phosphate synthase